MKKILFLLSSIVFTLATSAHASTTCPPGEAIHCISNHCTVDASYNDWFVQHGVRMDNVKFNFFAAVMYEGLPSRCDYISSSHEPLVLESNRGHVADFSVPGNKWQSKPHPLMVASCVEHDVNACPFK